MKADAPCALQVVTQNLESEYAPYHLEIGYKIKYMVKNEETGRALKCVEQVREHKGILGA